MTIDIKNILSWLKTNKVFLIVIAILVLIILIMFKCLGSISDKNDVLEHNYETAIEKIDTMRLANNNLLAEKQSYIASIKDLEKLLDINKKDIKDLQKKLDDKVMYISKLESDINIANIRSRDTVKVYNDSTIKSKFKFSSEWYNIEGYTLVKNYKAASKIESLKIQVPLTVGLTEDWSIFVTTPNPYVSFSNINGALLDKNQYTSSQIKRWGLDLNAGLFTGFDFINRSWYVGPGVGISFSYRIF